tara:strand:+ start:361 stop:573 length:213 start_codon:yes stop_codon:yes gene_type:complete
MIMALTETQKAALKELGKGKKKGTELDQYITAIHELAEKHLVSMREEPYLSRCRYWLTPIGKMVHDNVIK